MPENRAANLDVNGWSLGRFIDEAAARFGDLDAFIASDQRNGPAAPRASSYAQLRDDVHALQWALQDLGLRPGEKVGVMLSSFPEWIQLLFAVTRMGCAFMPISTRFRARELRHVLRHSEASLLVTVGRYLGHDYGATLHEACGARAGEGFAEMPHLREVVEVGGISIPGAWDAGQLLARGQQLLAERGAPPRADDASATAILFYTSGTTSFPKGVPLSHANLLPHSVRAGQLLHILPGERVLSLYPFFGISGGANKVLSTLGCGGCLVFQDAWRASEANALLDELQCTVLHAVDVQVRELVALRRQSTSTPVPCERRGTIAFMASLDESLASDMGKALGLKQFVHPYGMTETNPMILRNELADGFEQSVRPGGRVAPGVEVRVVDPETGAERAPGVPGEITVRGETVMSGYYKDPEATAAAFVDGWFRTGDQGVRDEHGFTFYLGRLKDMLKVGGFNVAPQEIESFLRTIEGVQDVAVTGAADARLGEVPIAFVVPKPGASLNAEDIVARCRGQIANFKVPQAVHVVDALPYHTAANGSKLQRHVLREWASERLR